MDIADDKKSDGEWSHKDVIVYVRAECTGEFDDGTIKNILMEELHDSIYRSDEKVYRFSVGSVTFTDRLN